MTDLVNNPSHYKHVSGVECIEISRWLPSGWAQALQYAWRWEKKGGAEDLRKAAYWVRDCVANKISTRMVQPALMPIRRWAPIRDKARADLRKVYESEAAYTPLAKLVQYLGNGDYNNAALFLADELEAIALRVEQAGSKP